MAAALSPAFAVREAVSVSSSPGLESGIVPSHWPSMRRSRLARLFIAWTRRQRIRAELRALDESQMRDAGITADALADALQLPLSHYAAETEPATPATNTFRRWSLPAVAMLSLAGIVGCTAPTLAHDRSRQACAALDLSLFSRIEEAGLANSVDPNELWAANEILLSARGACLGEDYASALERYYEADRMLARSSPE